MSLATRIASAVISTFTASAAFAQENSQAGYGVLNVKNVEASSNKSGGVGTSVTTTIVPSNSLVECHAAVFAAAVVATEASITCFPADHSIPTIIGCEQGARKIECTKYDFVPMQ